MKTTKHIALFIFCLMASIMSFTASAATANDASHFANGKTKYRQLCQACHGDKGLGDGPTTASLPSKPANIPNKLGEFFTTKNSLVDEILEGNIEEGMPAWQGFITKQDAIDVLDYIATIQR